LASGRSAARRPRGIAANLEQLGEKISVDATNEELVLRAWRQWAEKSLEALIGDFAFAIWDAEARQLWCVRDLLGARLFFYAYAGGQRQSTFLGAQFTPEALRRRAVDFVPVLSESGLAERWILQAMDGCTPLQEIARAAVERFPHVFRVQDDAFRRLSSLAEKFSR
jgi:asparagine synthetase B (glutamine-hydrolysing)